MLDSETLTFLNPQEVLEELDIDKQMLAADLGCGAGGWSIPLAKKLTRGRVYAFDVQEEMLSALKSRARLAQVFNIKTLLCDLESEQGTGLKDGSMDLVLVTNVLFQAEKKEKILKEAERILKKGGQLLVVDWKKNAPIGPKGKRVSADQVKKIAGELGLDLKKEFEAGDYHYALIFTK